jgi:hypothetical protein
MHFTLHCTTATTTKPCAQAHAIFNITSHDGNNDKALCASARHLYAASYNSDDDSRVAQRQQQQGLMSKRTPFSMSCCTMVAMCHKALIVCPALICCSFLLVPLVLCPNPGLGNTKSTNAATCAAANANSVACAANKEQRCSLARAVSANVAPHYATSRQQSSLARVVSADTAAQSANYWQHCSAAGTNSANAAVHLANSWR